MRSTGISPGLTAKLLEFNISLDAPPGERPARQFPQKKRDKNHEAASAINDSNQKKEETTMHTENTSETTSSINGTTAAAPKLNPIDELNHRLEDMASSQASLVTAVSMSADALDRHATQAGALELQLAQLIAAQRKDTTRTAQAIKAAKVTGLVAVGAAVGTVIGVRIARWAGISLPVVETVEAVTPAVIGS